MYFSLTSVSVRNIVGGFSPVDEREYVDFLRVVMGRMEEAMDLTPKLRQFVREYRPSVGNAKERVVIGFIPES